MRPVFRNQITHYLFAILSAFSLSLPAAYPQVRFKHLSSEQGLSQNTVNCILQDSFGFLWVGTQDGLNKYDGYGLERTEVDYG